jgi:type I restriction enzyme, S subunit
VIDSSDLYVVIVGATIGKAGRVPVSLSGMHLTENAARLVFREFDQQFLLLTLRSQSVQSQFVEKTYQQAQPKLALKRIESTLIHVPPLAEQKRIVAKVTELLSLCDALEAKLTQAESASTQLLSAAVHHLLSHST